MVLDEIDQLDSKNQEILYTIFEWPSLQKSRLILVGKTYCLFYLMFEPISGKIMVKTGEVEGN